MFSGTVRVKVCEATGLRPTDFQKRHNMTFGKPDDQPIDPYVSIDADEHHLDRSTTKPKPSTLSGTRPSSTKCRTLPGTARNPFRSLSPILQILTLMFSYSLGITVFHDAAIPPDDFVANCTIPLKI
ncbi:protein kinase C-like [Choristoneura fumiferana]|uniref:protein kinase C-like n=1 Tax=Choristoneura fumiferana TaxID=7141 RepID=UPI003D1562EB